MIIIMMMTEMVHGLEWHLRVNHSSAMIKKKLLFCTSVLLSVTEYQLKSKSSVLLFCCNFS